MRKPVHAPLSPTSCSKQLDIREFTLCKGLGNMIGAHFKTLKVSKKCVYEYVGDRGGGILRVRVLNSLRCVTRSPGKP